MVLILRKSIDLLAVGEISMVGCIWALPVFFLKRDFSSLNFKFFMTYHFDKINNESDFKKHSSF